MFSLSDTYTLGKKLLAQVAVDISSYDAVFETWHRSKKKWMDALNPDTGAISWPAELEITGGERGSMWQNACATYQRTLVTRSDLHTAMHRLRSYFPLEIVQTGVVPGKMVLSVPALTYDRDGKTISVQLRKGTKFSRAAAQILRELGIAEELVATAIDRVMSTAGFSSMKGTMTLSFNFLDILLSSMSASFSSCHDLFKEHASGNLQYACDPHTGVAYFYRDERPFYAKDMTFESLPFKTWRQLVVFDGHSKSVTFLRHYPQNTSISDANHRTLRQKCAAAMEKALELDHAPWVFNELGGDKDPSRERLTKALLRGKREGSNAYMDWCTSQIHHPTGHMEFTYEQKHPVCPCCGKRELMAASRFICDWCLKKHKPCYFCKKIIPAGRGTVLVDVKIECCPTCLPDYSCQCSSCGARMARGNECLSPKDRTTLCSPCFLRDFYRCTACGFNGELKDSIPSPTNNARRFCPICFDKRFRECSECHGHFSVSSMIDGDLCEECYLEREASHEDEDPDDEIVDDEFDEDEIDEEAPPPAPTPDGWVSISDIVTSVTTITYNATTGQTTTTTAVSPNTNTTTT